MEERARETLASLSVRTVKSVRQGVASLSGGQRQTVAIAKAVLWNSKVVLLDEPTAALGVAQTRQVLDLVRRLADQGLGVVLISHNMNDVFEVADRITAQADRVIEQADELMESFDRAHATLAQMLEQGQDLTTLDSVLARPPRYSARMQLATADLVLLLTFGPHGWEVEGEYD